MGTYITINDVQLYPLQKTKTKFGDNWADNFQKFFETQKELFDDWQDIQFYCDSNGELGHIEVSDWHTKYGSWVDNLWTFLSNHFTGWFQYTDDYSNVFRVVFDGNGAWDQVEGTLIFEEPDKHFIRCYRDELPKDIIERIEQWRLSRRI